MSTYSSVILADNPQAYYRLDDVYSPSIDQHLLVPAYVYPTTADWTQYIGGAPTVGYMIANPASGPGTITNSDYTTGIATARDAGIKVLGYVDTNFGARALTHAGNPTDNVEDDIDRWYTLYTVDGIMFDRVQGDSGHLSYYTTLYNYVRAKDATRNLVVLNPGSLPIESYTTIADTIIFFVTTFTTWQSSWDGVVSAPWIKNYPPSKWCAIVYSIPDSPNMKVVVQAMKDAGVGYIFATDQNGFGTAPSSGFWANELVIANATDNPHASAKNSAATAQHIFGPSYIYPTDPGWSQYVKAAPVVSHMIANVASGPGASPNSDYTTGINNARAAGIKVLGYVHTSYGPPSIANPTGRTLADVKADIDSWYSFYTIDGIMLDETQADAPNLSHYTSISTYIKSKDATRNYVTLNPGVVPLESYTAIADTICLFEEGYTGWQTDWIPDLAPSWIRNHPPTMWWAIVHTVPDIVSQRAVIQSMKDSGVGYIFTTDLTLPNPYNPAPSTPFWTDELSKASYNAPLAGVSAYGVTGAITGESDTALTFTSTGGLSLPSTLDYTSWLVFSLDFWVNVGDGWNYVAMTCDGSFTHIFFNGFDFASGAPPTGYVNGSPSVFLDLLFDLVTTTSGMSLDEVALYKVCLTPTQVQAHATAGGSRIASSLHLVDTTPAPVVDSTHFRGVGSVLPSAQPMLPYTVGGVVLDTQPWIYTAPMLMGRSISAGSTFTLLFSSPSGATQTALSNGSTVTMRFGLADGSVATGQVRVSSTLTGSSFVVYLTVMKTFSA